MPPKIPPANPLTGTETAIVIQAGKPVRTTTQDIADKASGSAGPKGDVGPQGQAGPSGPAGSKGEAGTAGATGPAGLQGTKGETGAAGAKGDTGPAGDPKRISRFTSSTNSAGIATLTFSPAFTATPDLDVIDGWSGDQMVTGAVIPGTESKNGCQVQVMLSRGALLLTSGPFQKAGGGVSITVRAIGN